MRQMRGVHCALRAGAHCWVEHPWASIQWVGMFTEEKQQAGPVICHWVPRCRNCFDGAASRPECGKISAKLSSPCKGSADRLPGVYELYRYKFIDLM